MLTALIFTSLIFINEPQVQQFALEPIANIRVASRFNATRLDARGSGIGVRVTGSGYIDTAEIYSNFSMKVIPSRTNPLEDPWRHFKERRSNSKARIERGLIEHDMFLLMPPLSIENTVLKGKSAKYVTFPFIMESDGEYLGRAMIVAYSAGHAVFIDFWARTLDTTAWQKILKRKLVELSTELKGGFTWRKTG